MVTVVPGNCLYILLPSEQVVLSIGTVSSVLFHVLVPHEDRPAYLPPPPVAEPPNAVEDDIPDLDANLAPLGVVPEPAQRVRRVKLTVVQWLKQPQLYQVVNVEAS
jgi:hypothetical protein